MKKQTLIIIIYLFTTFTASAFPIDSLAHFLQKYKMLESEYIYEGGEFSLQKSTSLAITKQLNNNELIQLTSHENLLVRCYSFKQLCINNSNSVIKIIENNINSKNEFSRIDGCLQTTQKIAQWYLEQSFQYCDIDIKNKVIKIIKKHHSGSLLTEETINQIPILKQNYSFIKDAYQKGDDRFLIPFLSYKDSNNDKIILKEYNDDSLKIVCSYLIKYIQSKELHDELSLSLLEIEDKYSHLRRKVIFIGLLKNNNLDIIYSYKNCIDFSSPLHDAQTEYKH